MLDRRLPFEFVYETLKKMSSLFTPPLSESLDIEAYARKLSDKAEFVVCMEEDELLGFTAYYLNTVKHQIYITLICVDSSYQAHGIGSKMLGHIAVKAQTVDYSYSTIALEVNKQNGKAHRFYQRQGFVEQENRGEKMLMVKAI
mgnify:CR=1 FL=1